MSTRRKLRLDPDLLRVESFDTAPGGSAPRGTVHGHSAWTYRGCATQPFEACSGTCEDEDPVDPTTLPCNESLNCDTSRCN